MCDIHYNMFITQHLIKNKTEKRTRMGGCQTGTYAIHHLHRGKAHKCNNRRHFLLYSGLPTKVHHRL